MDSQNVTFNNFSNHEPIPDPRRLLSESTTGVDIIPEKGFIHDYYYYAKELTEAPKIYHLFIGHALIAAVLGRKIYLPHGQQGIFPNLWILLLAPSSIYRKSTSINIGRCLLEEIDQNLILPSEFTPESIMQYLSSQPNGIFPFNEFGGTMGALINGI